MPTLNFEKTFIEPILDGTKTHTMRFGVRMIRKGQLLYCQYGQRFKPSRFAVLPAMRVRRIILTRDMVEVWDENGKGFIVPPRDKFAISDGFADWADLCRWFDAVYGSDRDAKEGQLIQWAQAGWEREWGSSG